MLRRKEGLILLEIILTGVAFSSTMLGHASAQDIDVRGICNLVINGNNNVIYGDICGENGLARAAIFDPPSLWLGASEKEVRRAIASRSPEIEIEGDIPVYTVTGALFGVPGAAQYAFDDGGKLIWMAVQAQCSEIKHVYSYSNRPDGLDPSVEEYHRAFNAWAFEMGNQETSCSKMLDALGLLEKLFGTPAADRSRDHNPSFTRPGDDFLCNMLYEGRGGHPECKNVESGRSTWDYEYIANDRMTGIGVELKEYYYTGVVQSGYSYFPEARRREMFMVLSIWGDSGRPVIEGHPYGPVRFMLSR